MASGSMETVWCGALPAVGVTDQTRAAARTAAIAMFIGRMKALLFSNEPSLSAAN